MNGESTLKRAEATYRQLHEVLLSLHFSGRASQHAPPGQLYEHETGVVVMLPVLCESDRVLDHRLAAVRLELDNFGLAVPSVALPNSKRPGEPSRGRKRSSE